MPRMGMGACSAPGGSPGPGGGAGAMGGGSPLTTPTTPNMPGSSRNCFLMSRPPMSFQPFMRSLNMAALQQFSMARAREEPLPQVIGVPRIVKA